MDKFFAIGFFGTLLSVFGLYLIFHRIFVTVQPAQSVLILAWGKCREVLSEPGLYLRPSLWIPGFRQIQISRQLDHEVFSDLHVNDLNGTTMRVDIWLEYKVVDAQKSLFAVESWQAALRHLVLHVTMEKMGHERLDKILTDRGGLAFEILKDVQVEAQAWGIQVESLLVQDIRLLPEISKQLFDRVAAKLELKKARLEEEGRIAVHTLQAETEMRIAEYQAQAKSLHPLAVGRAYSDLSQNQDVLNGFQELHQLSLLQPGKVVSFVGFKTDEIQPLDAMMIPEDFKSSTKDVTRSMNRTH